MTTPPIEDPARELMSAWAAHHAPSRAVHERTWVAVRERALAGELGPELGSSVASVELGRRVWLRWLLGGLGTVAVAIGVGLAATEPEPTLPSIAAPSLEPRPVEPVSGPPVVTPTPEPSPAVEQPEPTRVDAAVATPREPTRSPRRPASDDADSLTRELELLGAARTALKSGDITTALEALDQHRDQFPRGALRAERELSRITALCRADRLDEAEAAARRFIARDPNSTEAKRLRDTCIGDRLEPVGDH